MRIGLVSDIHSNYQALEAALNLLDSLKCDRVYVLGDIIGYGGDPGRCVDLVRRATDGAVKGNHEAALETPSMLQQISSYARAAILWTRQQLSDEQSEWIFQLPLEIKDQQLLLAHTVSGNEREWPYLQTVPQLAGALEQADSDYVFCGHTHRVMLYRDDSRFIMTTGSVGQPRDGDPRGVAITWDGPGELPREHRFDYDVHAAVRTIRDAGLPEFLAVRLLSGS